MKPLRCKKYLMWVRKQNSCVSMCPADDPHHIINLLPGGMGTKTHDFFTIPLTRQEHQELHNIGGIAWEKKTGINQAEEVLRTLNNAINEGLIEIRWINE